MLASRHHLGAGCEAVAVTPLELALSKGRVAVLLFCEQTYCLYRGDLLFWVLSS